MPARNQPSCRVGRPKSVRCMGMRRLFLCRLAPVLGSLTVLVPGLLLAGCRASASSPAALAGSQSPQPSSSSPMGPSASPALEAAPQPPQDARQVQTGPNIQQWQAAGTTITSLWMDLEAGMIVQITGQSLDTDRRQRESPSMSSTRKAGAGPYRPVPRWHLSDPARGRPDHTDGRHRLAGHPQHGDHVLLRWRDRNTRATNRAIHHAMSSPVATPVGDQIEARVL